LSAVVVDLTDLQAWAILPVFAGPLYLVYRAHSSHVSRLHEDDRRREVLDAVEQGMAVVDSRACVMLWNDAMERILATPRSRAVGRTLAAARPVLAKSDLPRAVEDVLLSRSPRTLGGVSMPAADGARLLEIKILPVAEGATLLCYDVTERIRTFQSLRRSEERLALAAEGANDGLWEW